MVPFYNSHIFTAGNRCVLYVFGNFDNTEIHLRCIGLNCFNVPRAVKHHCSFTCCELFFRVSLSPVNRFLADISFFYIVLQQCKRFNSFRTVDFIVRCAG